jgi:hypothetical protein
MLKLLDTHEGAEAPIVGTIAAISGLISGLATDTQDFSHRLKKRPRPSDIEAPSSPSVQTADDPTSTPKSSTKPPLSPHHLNNMAWRMAVKTFDDDNLRNFHEPPKNPNRNLAIMREKIAKRKARGGRAYQIASATAHYVGDVAATSAKGESVFHSFITSEVAEQAGGMTTQRLSSEETTNDNSPRGPLLQPSQRLRQRTDVRDPARDAAAARRHHGRGQRAGHRGQGMHLSLSPLLLISSEFAVPRPIPHHAIPYHVACLHSTRTGTDKARNSHCTSRPRSPASSGTRTWARATTA